MKKKIVLALLTATVAGAALTGCGGKTAETAPAETVETTDEASDEDVETSEKIAEDSADESLDENDVDNAEATDEEVTAEGEETASEDDIDEAALLDSEIPNDPEEVVAIIKSIKDYDIRCEYALKANDKFDGNDEASLKWADLIYPYWQPILDKTDIEE